MRRAMLGEAAQHPDGLHLLRQAYLARARQDLHKGRDQAGLDRRLPDRPCPRARFPRQQPPERLDRAVDGVGHAGSDAGEDLSGEPGIPVLPVQGFKAQQHRHLGLHLGVLPPAQTHVLKKLRGVVPELLLVSSGSPGIFLLAPHCCRDVVDRHSSVTPITRWWDEQERCTRCDAVPSRPLGAQGLGALAVAPGPGANGADVGDIGI